MNDPADTFMVITLFIAVIVLAWHGATSASDLRIGKYAIELIESCESELPREDSCIIVAVPK